MNNLDANGNLLSLQRNNQAGVMLNKSAIVYSDSVMQLRTYLMPMDKTNITINWKEDRNILFYQSVFDSFKYKYLEVGDKTVSNRLYHVNDSINANIMTDDIDDEGTYSFASETINSWNNYGYDEIGNLQRDSIEGIKHIEWTAYGKIKSIERHHGYYKTINDVNVYPSNLEFLYDAMGNRIAKIEKPRDANGQKSSADWKTTYYIRDAQGNPMATYSRSSQNQEASYTLTERPMYGSSRVGIDNYSLEFVGYTPPTNNITNHILGLKQYELSNHLGNVLTTISDKKFPIDNSGMIDHYVADITSVSDYYPFGSPMDGRTFGSFRYGFNGKEQDNEIQGGGNAYDFGARVYDSRLGRWLALDPLAAKYPGMSPYCFVANSPLIFVDPDGREVKAHDAASKDLVIKTMTFLFGEEHGFGFDNNNNLLHNGVMPEKMTNEQQLMFKYVVETLVESTTLTYVQVTNQDFNTYESATMIIPEYLGEKVSGRSTFIGEGKKMTVPKNTGEMGLIIKRNPNTNWILIPERTIINGSEVEFTNGILPINAQYVLIHEFAHAIVKTINVEMDGVFNGVDFKAMSPQQQTDWAIRFMNTLNQSQKMPMETGAGQHGRNEDQRPASEDVKPLTE